jgi:hypothetical protein
MVMASSEPTIYSALRETLLSQLTGNLDYDAKVVADYFERLDINPPDPIDRMLAHISFVAQAMD